MEVPASRRLAANPPQVVAGIEETRQMSYAEWQVSIGQLMQHGKARVG